ncbi:MAG: phosphate acyltransferase PlsX [Gammaproteobacteria bacterium]|nr:phosphate acyltransferase PlsX [Gammaproteobacteria bacterium]
MKDRVARPIVIAVDAMSGDRGPEVVIKAAGATLEAHPNVRISLVGREPELAEHLDKLNSDVVSRITLHHATQVVAMDEHPRLALRSKKDSSMRRALQLVKDHEADACVSAGNTGALVAKARFVLKRMPGVDRPAIVATIPSRGGHTCMLDLGANTDCTASQLVQFAVMGGVIAEDVFELPEPRIGLLNIGEESIKGTNVIREAAKALESTSVNYIGYVEGHDIFTGRVDVVVSDGFTGNIALKTIEGAYGEILNVLREEFTRGPARKAMALASKPIINSLRARLDPRRYNGASLVGLRGIVIKSHGNADEIALTNAINLAVLESEKGVPSQVGERLARLQTELGVC